VCVENINYIGGHDIRTQGNKGRGDDKYDSN
jgi:hypothetical protein